VFDLLLFINDMAMIFKIHSVVESGDQTLVTGARNPWKRTLL